MSTPRHLGILGAGPIGRVIGRFWIEAGHRVTFGVRTPEKLREFVDELGPRAAVTSLEQAAAGADIVLNALNHGAVDSVLTAVAPQLAGKIVIDASNPMGVSEEGRIISTLALTEGTHVARLLPESTVVRAFTHVMDESLAYRGSAQPGFWAVAVAGDDPDANDIVHSLVRATGFVPVHIGTLAESGPLDPGGVLFPHMFTPADLAAQVAAAKGPVG
ncbi:NADPH-dependent F420 reductase [Actinomadura harenae]|uniref:NADPH-dependent F420 reductase n=1 Tax=Actinomadura harenae TaxID=2483351 RepID=UPI0018F28857|nr:NAD(P)-binding domain-containing protein [Actinomadura harenae]